MEDHPLNPSCKSRFTIPPNGSFPESGGGALSSELGTLQIFILKFWTWPEPYFRSKSLQFIARMETRGRSTKPLFATAGSRFRRTDHSPRVLDGSCRANSAHMRQSWPESGPGLSHFWVQILKTRVRCSLGRGADGPSTKPLFQPQVHDLLLPRHTSPRGAST